MRRPSDTFAALSLLLTLALFLFLLLPLGIVLVQSLNDSRLGLWPPSSLSLTWYAAAVGDQRVHDVFMTSVQLAVAVAAISTMLGGMAGYAIGRYRFRGRTAVGAIVVFPILLPALLLAMGLIIVLTSVGIHLSFWALLFAHVTVVLPFATLIVAVQSSSFDSALEDASRDLGASWFYGVRRVVIPNLAGALRAALLFSFVLSFNESILALFLGGVDQTLPAYMFGEFQQLMTPEVDAIAALLVGLAALALVAEPVVLRRLTGGAR